MNDKGDRSISGRYSNDRNVNDRDSSASIDELAKRVLDDECRELDTSIHAELNQVRTQALNRLEKPSLGHRLWSQLYEQWLPVTVLASLFIVALNLDFNTADKQPSAQLAKTQQEVLLLELAFAEEELAFYQQLAFVEWMDEWADEESQLLDASGQHDA